MNESLYQVDAPHMCAGLIVADGKVIEAAPIVSWAVGKHINYFLDWCKRKNYKCIQIKTH
jgi:hypothetical protein